MDLPIRMLLAVIVLAFTATMGYSALESHFTVQEELASAKAMGSFLTKAQMAGMGAPGSREDIRLILEQHSKLTLKNENLSGDIRGIVRIDLTRGGNFLKVLPLPIWDSSREPSSYEDLLEKEIVYLRGTYLIMVTHRSVEIAGKEVDYFQVE